MTSTSNHDFLNNEDNKSEESNSGKTETKTLDLYDANKGIVKRDGGPYLDQVERESAEIIRAQKEGRKPDLENPPATAGTYLVPKSYLRETDASNSHTSASAEQENVPEATVNVEVPAETEPDPRQVDWDNDHQKVRAIDQKATFNEAAKKDTDSPEDSKPVSEAAPDQPDAKENNENIVTGVANNSWTPPGSPNAPVADKKSEVKDNKNNG